MGVLRKEGIDGVSMRRVATELSTGAASLYAHVANKDELVELLFDEVAAGVADQGDELAHLHREVDARQSFECVESHADGLDAEILVRFHS